jgi:hypothetical protein
MTTSGLICTSCRCQNTKKKLRRVKVRAVASFISLPWMLLKGGLSGILKVLSMIMNLKKKKSSLYLDQLTIL